MLPRDYQLDVVTDKPVHVDFFRLKAGSRVRIAVPVHVVNRELSPGLKKGGAVNLVLHSVELLAPAESIPESITIDLTGLDFHDSVHVSALKLPEGCRPADTRIDYTVVTVVPPTVFQEETPAAAAATSGAAPAAAPPPAAAPAAGRRPGQGRRRGPGQGRRRRAGQAGRQEVTRRPQRRVAQRVRPVRPSRRAGLFITRVVMLLIAGLGNPGARHAKNRHNIGFMAVERIAETHRIGPFRARFQGLDRRRADRPASASRC